VPSSSRCIAPAGVASKIGDIVLKAGDTVSRDHPHFLKYPRQRGFFSPPPSMARAPRHEKAWLALAILAGVIAVARLEPFTHQHLSGGVDGCGARDLTLLFGGAGPTEH
jgi:hypothetical protein